MQKIDRGEAQTDPSNSFEDLFTDKQIFIDYTKEMLDILAEFVTNSDRNEVFDAVDKFYTQDEEEMEGEGEDEIDSKSKEKERFAALPLFGDQGKSLEWLQGLNKLYDPDYEKKEEDEGEVQPDTALQPQIPFKNRVIENLQQLDETVIARYVIPGLLLKIMNNSRALARLGYWLSEFILENLSVSNDDKKYLTTLRDLADSIFCYKELNPAAALKDIKSQLETIFSDKQRCIDYSISIFLMLDALHHITEAKLKDMTQATQEIRKFKKKFKKKLEQLDPEIKMSFIMNGYLKSKTIHGSQDDLYKLKSISNFIEKCYPDNSKSLLSILFEKLPEQNQKELIIRLLFRFLRAKKDKNESKEIKKFKILCVLNSFMKSKTTGIDDKIKKQFHGFLSKSVLPLLGNIEEDLKQSDSEPGCIQEVLKIFSKLDLLNRPEYQDIIDDLILRYISFDLWDEKSLFYMREFLRDFGDKNIFKKILVGFVKKFNKEEKIRPGDMNLFSEFFQYCFRNEDIKEYFEDILDVFVSSFYNWDAKSYDPYNRDILNRLTHIALQEKIKGESKYLDSLLLFIGKLIQDVQNEQKLTALYNYIFKSSHFMLHGLLVSSSTGIVGNVPEKMRYKLLQPLLERFARFHIAYYNNEGSEGSSKFITDLIMGLKHAKNTEEIEDVIKYIPDLICYRGNSLSMPVIGELLDLLIKHDQGEILREIKNDLGKLLLSHVKEEGIGNDDVIDYAIPYHSCDEENYSSFNIVKKFITCKYVRDLSGFLNSLLVYSEENLKKIHSERGCIQELLKILSKLDLLDLPEYKEIIDGLVFRYINSDLWDSDSLPSMRNFSGDFDDKKIIKKILAGFVKKFNKEKKIRSEDMKLFCEFFHHRFTDEDIKEYFEGILDVFVNFFYEGKTSCYIPYITILERLLIIAMIEKRSGESKYLDSFLAFIDKLIQDVQNEQKLSVLYNYIVESSRSILRYGLSHEEISSTSNNIVAFVPKERRYELLQPLLGRLARFYIEYYKRNPSDDLKYKFTSGLIMSLKHAKNTKDIEKVIKHIPDLVSYRGYTLSMSEYYELLDLLIKHDQDKILGEVLKALSLSMLNEVLDFLIRKNAEGILIKIKDDLGELLLRKLRYMEEPAILFDIVTNKFFKYKYLCDLKNKETLRELESLLSLDLKVSAVGAMTLLCAPWLLLLSSFSEKNVSFFHVDNWDNLKKQMLIDNPEKYKANPEKLIKESLLIWIQALVKREEFTQEKFKNFIERYSGKHGSLIAFLNWAMKNDELKNALEISRWSFIYDSDILSKFELDLPELAEEFKKKVSEFLNDEVEEYRNAS